MYDPIIYPRADRGPARCLPTSGRHFLVAALYFALASGCAPAPARDIPLSMFAAEYARARCDAIRACYGDTLTSILLEVSSASACETMVEREYENRTLPRVEAAIAMGRLVYVSSRAGACVDSIRSRGCALMSTRVTAECDAVFIGSVAPDASCTIDEECSGDSYCSPSAGCDGRCRARGEVAASCVESDGCRSGLFCSSGHECAEPTAGGVGCVPTSPTCQDGLACVGTPAWCSSPEIVLLNNTHCALFPFEICQEGFSCTPSAGYTLCVPNGLADGDACHPGVPDPCAADHYCGDSNAATGDYDGTCVALPTEGMPCGTVLQGPRCADGYTCESEVCVAIHANGEACMTSADCYSRACEGGLCVAPACR